MCTSFCFKKENTLVFGRNLDMFTDVGCVFTNHRDIQKIALAEPLENPLTWISRYGSITFNQAGKEFPNGGMNEEGLVIEQNTLPQTEYPSADERSAIGELQWIQFMLDTCCSVNEVIEAAHKIRILPNSLAKIHYLICDSSGDCCVIEHIEGKMIVLTKESLPYKILTNNLYQDGVRFIENDQTFEVDANNFYLFNSLERFKKGVEKIEDISHGTVSPIEYGFEVLKEVSREDTVWSIEYNISDFSIYFRTKKFPTVKSISLKEIDFSSKSEGKALNMNIEIDGDITEKLDLYSMKINKQLLYALYRNEIFINVLNVNLSDEIVDYLASYPEQMKKY